ncbi:MAG TPA: DUF2637 domain-containing protein [Streptosporangiaceae bacterium]
MSVQTVGTGGLPDDAAQFGAAEPEKAPRALRILALAAVVLGVAALAAATFVLSYSAIRAVALQAGITPRLARGYPLLLDAMLVIVLAAVLALRGAGLPSRLLAWLTLLVVLAAAAGADALHAAGRTLPHQRAAIGAAVLPWVLVLVAFGLLLAMLRHARLRRVASTHTGVAAYGSASVAPSGPAGTVPPASTVPPPAIVQPVVTVPRQPGPASVADADPGFADPAGAQPELALDAELAPDDPSTDEGTSEPADGATPYPAESLPHAAYDDGEDGDDGEADAEPDVAEQLGDETDSESASAKTEQDDPDMPIFHRMWSSPTRPAGP